MERAWLHEWYYAEGEILYLHNKYNGSLPLIRAADGLENLISADAYMQQFQHGLFADKARSRRDVIGGPPEPATVGSSDTEKAIRTGTHPPDQKTTTALSGQADTQSQVDDVATEAEALPRDDVVADIAFEPPTIPYADDEMGRGLEKFFPALPHTPANAPTAQNLRGGDKTNDMASAGKEGPTKTRSAETKDIAMRNFPRSFLDQNRTYVDVGANIGSCLIPMLHNRDVRRAVAFEPVPENLFYLKESLGALPASVKRRKKIHLVEMAASNTSRGTRVLYSDHWNRGDSGIVLRRQDVEMGAGAMISDVEKDADNSAAEEENPQQDSTQQREDFVQYKNGRPQDITKTHTTTLDVMKMNTFISSLRRPLKNGNKSTQMHMLKCVCE